MAAGVAGDELVIGNEGTETSCGIADKRGDWCSGLHIAHLQRLVLRGGDGTPPVPDSPPGHGPGLCGLGGCGVHAPAPHPNLLSEPATSSRYVVPRVAAKCSRLFEA